MILNLLVAWLIIHFLLLFVSTFKVRSNRKGIDFIYHWGFSIGAYCWEDLMIFSFFNIVTTIIAIGYSNIKIWLLFFIVFWIVRSIGEALYWFLQQFNQPTQYPHDQYQHFKPLKRIFGDISLQKCFIIMQVIYQVILVFSIVLLILLLKNWDIIKSI